MQGEVKNFYESGQVKAVGQFQNDIANGETILYYDNGQIDEQTNYLNGKLDGKATYYYDNGQVEFIKHFSNDTLHGEYKEYFKNGQLQCSGQYNKGNMGLPKCGVLCGTSNCITFYLHLCGWTLLRI
jgi:antitoxin component YwqK of YwqJK toxin-antitoxin module